MTSPTNNVSLWDTTFFQITKEEAAVRESFRDWLRESSSPLGNYLADVGEFSPAGTFKLDDVHALERAVAKAWHKKGEALLRLKLLAKIVYQLNCCLQKSIPQPRLAELAKQEPNPIVPDNALAHGVVAACLRLETQWIASLSPLNNPGLKNTDANVPPELIVFSAGLHGELPNIESAVALFEALRRPEANFHCSTKKLWADLSLAWNAIADQEIRRWYPSELSVCLTSRISRDFLKESALSTDLDYSSKSSIISRRIFDAVVGEARRQKLEHPGLLAGSEPLSQVKSLAHLFDLVRVVLHSEIPSMLAEVAARKIDCRTQLCSSIGRTYGDPAILLPQLSADQEGDWDDKVDIDLEDASDEGKGDIFDAPWLPFARAAFASGDPEQVTTMFQKMLHVPCEVDAIQKEVCTFAIDMVQRGASSGRPLKLPSIKCLVLTVARRLIPMLEGKDPVHLKPETLETIYLRTLEETGKDSVDPHRLQRTVAWVLREFHRFLVRMFDAPCINESEVFRFWRGHYRVDARIITLDDVFAALELLDRNIKENPRRIHYYRIAQAEIILGFFAGLRRMEGIGLLRVDFLGDRMATVLIRPSEARGLKTANATRLIQLLPMVYPFVDLLKYLDYFRHPNNNSPSGDTEASLFDGVSDDIIIPIIHNTLQVVTGDHINYHILRHSFCSWTFLRMMLSELPSVPNLFEHLSINTQEWVKQSWKFRLLLYGNDLVTNDHLWALSTLAGHSSPSVTEQNYIHVCDILLPIFLRESAVFGTIDDTLFHQATGLPSSTLFDWKDRLQHSAIALPLQTKIALERFRKRFGSGAPLWTPPEKAEPRPWHDGTFGLLFEHGRAGDPVYYGTNSSDFEFDKAAEILNRAGRNATLKVLNGSSLLHSILNQPAADGSGTKGRGCCPLRPSGRVVGTLIDQYADRVGEFAETYQRQARDLLDFIVQNLSADSLSLSFLKPSPSRVRNYIQCLAMLGFPRDSIEFVSRDGKKAKRPSREFLRTWGLSESDSVMNESDGRRGPKSASKWLRLNLPLLSSDEEKALRFVMLLASARFGGRSGLGASQN